MISDEELPELAAFRRVEAQVPFELTPSLGNLVVASGNERLPVHRWFRFKESFSPDLLKIVLENLRGDLGTSVRMLDPFCGVGTSLIAAQELHGRGYSVNAVGIERNPFIAFASRAKVSWPILNLELLRTFAAELATLKPDHAIALPSLSSIRDEKCISAHTARRLLSVRNAIWRHGSSATHDALLLGLASSIEELSRTRKDGRALRLVSRPRTAIAPVLAQRWNAIAEDVGLFQRTIGLPPVPLVLHGDGRRPLALGIQDNSQDLILTSPPYPNNIDYTEVYKLELWLLGFVSTASEFLALRRQTFRSHPTCGLESPSPDFLAAAKRGRLRSLLNPLTTKISVLRPWRRRVLLGYFSDLWITLSECHRVLRDDGYAVFVVGNSLHGGAALPYLIPTDLLLGTIAAHVGFSVQQTIAARALKRRVVGNHFLRESLVVLRKHRG